MSAVRPEDLQAQYYARTAAAYDAMHGADDEHARALRLMSSMIRERDLASILDVGCGTGRGVKHFLAEHPGLNVCGIEPVAELREKGIDAGIPRERLLDGSGESLPFPDGAFDAVCELGVLHHVKDPDRVVSEMLRVARRAVFVSDSNRFGQGPLLARWLKVALHKARLWPVANFVHTRGRGYHVSEGDGISYSYSVYDNYAQIAAWAKQIILVPSFEHDTPSWFAPLVTSGHVVLCAFR